MLNQTNFGLNIKNSKNEKNKNSIIMSALHFHDFMRKENIPEQRYY